MPAINAQGVSNSVGVHQTPPQGFARINGSLIVVDGTPVTPHGEGIHNGAFTANGAAFARIAGIPINRDGDVATCGHPNTGGYTFARVS